MHKIIFEWDERKAQANKAKHKISFELAALVFSDPLAVSTQDRVESNEERWQTIGKVGGHSILLVAHTVQFDDVEVVRIVSARKATSREVRYYEES